MKLKKAKAAKYVLGEGMCAQFMYGKAFFASKGVHLKAAIVYKVIYVCWKLQLQATRLLRACIIRI